MKEKVNCMSFNVQMLSETPKGVGGEGGGGLMEFQRSLYFQRRKNTWTKQLSEASLLIDVSSLWIGALLFSALLFGLFFCRRYKNLLQNMPSPLPLYPVPVCDSRNQLPPPPNNNNNNKSLETTPTHNFDIWPTPSVPTTIPTTCASLAFWIM